MPQKEGGAAAPLDMGQIGAKGARRAREFSFDVCLGPGSSQARRRPVVHARDCSVCGALADFAPLRPTGQQVDWLELAESTFALCVAQEDVFAAVEAEQLVETALDGYSVTVFAFGASLKGKSSKW